MFNWFKKLKHKKLVKAQDKDKLAKEMKILKMLSDLDWALLNSSYSFDSICAEKGKNFFIMGREYNMGGIVVFFSSETPKNRFNNYSTDKFLDQEDLEYEAAIFLKEFHSNTKAKLEELKENFQKATQEKEKALIYKEALRALKEQ